MFLTNCLRRLFFHKPQKRNLKELCPPTNRFWRKKQTLRFAWNRFGRQRNCFSIAVKYVNKALMRSTTNRHVKRVQQRALWDTRIEAASMEHGLQNHELMEGLARCNILLDRKMLSELAIYEPRTFQSLTEVSKKKLEQEGLIDYRTPPAKNVITRGML